MLWVRRVGEKAGPVILYVLIASVVLGPIGYLIYGSLRSASPFAVDAHYTLENWATVYGPGAHRTAFFNTMKLAVLVAIISVILGTILAWLVARTDVPGRRQLSVLLIIPLMVSNLITALAWIALAAPNAGFINASARALFGIDTLFDIYSFAGIALILTLNYASLSFLAMYAAIGSVDASLEEAATMLGGRSLHTAVRMTVPLTWPTMAATFLIVFVFVAENFSVPTLLGAPVGFYTLSTQVYLSMAQEPSNPPLAAAAGTMLVWIAAIGIIWQRRILKRAGRYVTIGGKGSRHQTIHLGRRMRYLGSAFCFGYVAFAVVIPYLALIFGSLLRYITPRITASLFTLDNWGHLFGGANWLPMRNSLVLSIGGALVATLIYILLSYLLHTRKDRLSGAIDYLTIVPTAIPALALALGLLWQYVSFPVGIYGTHTMLLLAYFTRYLGYGVRQSSGALVQVSDELVEAARISGAMPLRAFRDITLPLLKPAVLSLWTLLFIFFFVEVAATILLYSPKTATLPVVLWVNMAAGYPTRGFAVAVFQASLILGVLFVANRLFGVLKNMVER